jgi:hypothetical protein
MSRLKLKENSLRKKEKRQFLTWLQNEDFQEKIVRTEEPEKLNAAAKAGLLNLRRTLEDTTSLFEEESKAFSQKTGASSSHPGMVETSSETNAGSLCRRQGSFLTKLRHSCWKGLKGMEDLREEREKQARKRCDVAAKALLFFNGLLSILRTDDKDSTPWKIMQARQRAKKALEAWWTTQLSVTPKCHASESHACDQLKLQWGLVDFCQDWVEQLCQLGLKNDQRTKTIGDRDKKCKLPAHWEQSNGNTLCRRQRRKLQWTGSGRMGALNAKKQQQIF